jgi:alpha,alpha-trehalase
VEGLLASGMIDTARGLVQNLLDDVASFGFVPNGGRIYYLNRSQPPLLCEMVATVARAMGSAAVDEWLVAAVPNLLREYDWWMDRLAPEGGRHAVCIDGHTLNRYHASCSSPRPESYREDWQTAAAAAAATNPSSHDDDGTALAAAAIFTEIASAAETGWDFSSRWTRAGSEFDGVFSLADTATTRVLPVDLNCILYRAELTLAALCEATARKVPLCEVEAAMRQGGEGHQLSDGRARALTEAASARWKAMDSLLWQPTLGRWVDFWLPATSHGASAKAASRQVPTLSDFAAPLWAGLAQGARVEPGRSEKVLAALKRSGLLGKEHL